jgi:hypothetical protein
MVMILMLSGVAAAFVMRPWQHDRDSNETTGGPEITSQPPPAVEPAPPSAVELANTAQCGTATSTSTSRLTNITSGRHDTFDRIVLAFAGPQPECSAGYVLQIVADGSGQPISLDGNAFLRVTLRGAAAHDDAGKMTYSGPATMDTPELANITAVALAGDFEGEVTIGVGMNVETDYKVFALSGPTRVVIDVGH